MTARERRDQCMKFIYEMSAKTATAFKRRSAQKHKRLFVRMNSVEMCNLLMQPTHFHRITRVLKEFRRQH